MFNLLTQVMPYMCCVIYWCLLSLAFKIYLKNKSISFLLNEVWTPVFLIRVPVSSCLFSVAISMPVYKKGTVVMWMQKKKNVLRVQNCLAEEIFTYSLINSILTLSQIDTKQVSFFVKNSRK